MKKIRCGIVGCGLISQLAHIPNLKTMGNVELVALCDVRQEVAAKLQRQFEVPKLYATAEELLADRSIQTVLFAVPQYLHGEILLNAAASGKSIFTDKPLAVSSDEGEKIVDEVRKRNVKFMVGFMKRYDPGVRKAKSLIEQYKHTKELGDITYGRVHNFTGDWLPGIDIEEQIFSLVRENVAKKACPMPLPSSRERTGLVTATLSMFSPMT